MYYFPKHSYVLKQIACQKLSSDFILLLIHKQNTDETIAKSHMIIHNQSRANKQ